MINILSIFLLPVIFVSLIQAQVYRGIFVQECSPYISGGQQRVGAAEPCNNACFAVRNANTLKPGRLTRAANSVNDPGCSAGPSSASSCRNGNSPYAGNPGDTCDEYPFAISAEGAVSRVPAILRCVPNAESSSTGGQLTQFFNHFGVNVGDTFDVAVHWFGAAPALCVNALVNDGAEFRWAGLVNARRSLRDFETSGLSTVDTPANITVPIPPFRLAITQKGISFYTLSSLSKVGDPVWSDADDFGSDVVVQIVDEKKPVQKSEQEVLSQ